MPLRRSAFTLVELLVVLAIIGVMAAMLLPALTTAREAANRARCASNFHQILVFTHTYATDNRSILPSFNRDGYGISGVIYVAWNHSLGATGNRNSVMGSALVKTTTAYLNLSWEQRVWTNDTMTLPGIFNCPSIGNRQMYSNDGRSCRAGQFDFDGATGNTVAGFATWLGLNVNSAGQPWIRGNNIALDRLTAPSEESYLYDRYFFATSNGGSTLTATAAGAASAAHCDGAGRAEGLNQGFADGSVRWIHRSRFNYYFMPVTYSWDRRQSHPMYADPTYARLNRGGYPRATFGPTNTTTTDLGNKFFGMTTGGWGGNAAGGVFTP